MLINIKSGQLWKCESGSIASALYNIMRKGPLDNQSVEKCLQSKSEGNLLSQQVNQNTMSKTERSVIMTKFPLKLH